MRRALFALVTAWTGAGVVAAGEVVIRLEVVDPPARVIEETETLTRVELSIPSGTARVPVHIDVVIETSLEPCATTPEECAENFRTVGEDGTVTYGCGDSVDNDGDGRIDLADPGCIGVQGWNIAVATDSFLGLYPDPLGASLHGTFADDDTRPPGLADVEGGFFRYQNVIDPARNGGQHGVFGTCALSFLHPTMLPPVGSFPVMNIRGDLDVAALRAAGPGALCLLDVRGPGEQGLSGRGDPSTTLVTVRGQSYVHATRDLTIAVAAPVAVPFQRGNPNGDVSFDLSDGVFILNFLFLGGDRPDCLDSADADDDGHLTITDGIAVFGFLFFGFDALPTPGPRGCGLDPSLDDVPCDAFPGCS